METTGDLAKYRPFTSLELRTTALEHFMCWFFVAVAGYGWSGAIAGWIANASDLWAKNLALGIIGTAGGVAFFWRRAESTGGFLRSAWRRNHLRYAVVFSKSLNEPEITRGSPFLLREWNDRLVHLRLMRQGMIHILVPLDGSVGTALVVTSRSARDGWNPHLQAERLHEWSFGGVDLHDLPDMSMIRIRDPNGGEAPMLLNDAFDFVRDAPFGDTELCTCTFSGFFRHQVQKIAALAAEGTALKKELDKKERDFSAALNLATEILRRVYASRTLATSTELESIRWTLDYGLRQLLPEGDARIPTPVVFKDRGGGRDIRDPWD